MFKVSHTSHCISLLVVLISVISSTCRAWTSSLPISTWTARPIPTSLQAAPASPSETAKSVAQLNDIQESVDSLKSVLSKEYASFFDPMERDFYSQDVRFIDPLTSLCGVDSYQANVDMLASRTLLGKVLFRDAGIILHRIDGGVVDPNDHTRITDIVTRWTLRMTVQILPWAPTARFSGVSVYKVSPGGPKGAVITEQSDYWDSINLQTNGSYAPVDKSLAIQDFLKQLSPDKNLQAAPSAGVELPYQLLRRGRDYEVRKYPSYTAVATPYSRRDEGYAILDFVTAGRTPLAPALMTVKSDQKTMQWPLSFALPGESAPASLSLGDRLQEQPECQVVTLPEQVVAIGSFQDASLEPVVRRADQELRKALQRDGIVVPSQGEVMFAQYDAVYSVGQRRGEVWIPLEPGSHPW